MMQYRGEVSIFLYTLRSDFICSDIAHDSFTNLCRILKEHMAQERRG